MMLYDTAKENLCKKKKISINLLILQILKNPDEINIAFHHQLPKQYMNIVRVQVNSLMRLIFNFLTSMH